MRIVPRHAVCADLRRCRTASWRLPVLETGRSDPWWYPDPGERGYEDAAHHLLSYGLIPAPNREGLRLMGKSGSESRRAAELIAERWGTVA
jgi:hypothetical protein